MSIKSDFVQKYHSHAMKVERETGVPALFALAQSALESGWGRHAPKNMMFGVKVGSGKSWGGWQGEKQLITTTEYSSKANRKFPYIYPGYPKRTASGKYKYRVKDYFRAFPSPYHAFLDWAGLLTRASRYRKALAHGKAPYRFAEEVIKGGYATDPKYFSKLKSVMEDVEALLPKKGDSVAAGDKGQGFRGKVGAPKSRFWVVAVSVGLLSLGGIVFLVKKQSG